MAKVLNQGIETLNKVINSFIPELGTLQCGTPYAKKLGALPAFLASALPQIVIDTNSTIGNDGFGWSYPISQNGERISLVVAIVNSENEVCTYDRKNQDIGKEQNANIGVDAIGSKGYAVNGLYDKVPKELWDIRIKSAKVAKNIAWEQTDGDGDCENVLMPIILIELEENPLCALSVDDIKNPTAKMQAVIAEFKNHN